MIGSMLIEVGVCPGPCNQVYRDALDAYRAALAEYDEHGRLDSNQTRPERPAVRPRRGDPIWCGKHRTRIVDALAQLDTLAGLIGWAADGHAASSDAAERVSGSAEPLSPSEWGDQLEALTGCLAGWEILYRRHLGAEWVARHGELAATHTELISWLGTHLLGPRGLLSITTPIGPSPADPPFAAAFGMEILAWHRSWYRTARAGVRKITKPLRCPTCHLELMQWVEGDAVVTCENPACHRVMSYDDYEAMVEHIAGQPA